MSRTNENLQPLLVKYAVARIGDDQIPGEYDRHEKVWVIKNKNGKTPIILSNGPLLETATKTMEQLESEDENMYLLESSTKTENRPERDDQDSNLNSFFLELATKTKSQRERDDQ